MTYAELLKNTEAIFDNDLRLPTNKGFEVSIDSQRYEDERVLKVYDYRRWQLQQMGFQQFRIEDLLKLVYGESYTEYVDGKKSRYEWVYNHFTGYNERKHWSHPAENYYNYKEYGFFHWPPFAKELKWASRLVNLTDVKVSDETMLKVLRLQTLNVFNAFQVLERVKPRMNSILLGSVWELPIYREVRSSGWITYYFLSEC